MTTLPFQIRDERPDDLTSIREVNREAFGQPLEGDIVDALRANDGVLASLVATIGDRVIGHILFSAVSVPADAGEVGGAGLGPMAVLPRFQRQGAGGAMIEAGIARIRALGLPFVVVLGHADYYPRFGFEPASRRGISCEWDVPDAAFMLLVLDESRMAGVGGQARYRPEFSSVE